MYSLLKEKWEGAYLANHPVRHLDIVYPDQFNIFIAIE